MDDLIWVVYDPYLSRPVHWGDQEDCVLWVMREDPQHESGMYTREAFADEQLLYGDGGLFTEHLIRMIAEIIADRESVSPVVIGKRMIAYGGPGTDGEATIWDSFIGPMLDSVQDALNSVRMEV